MRLNDLEERGTAASYAVSAISAVTPPASLLIHDDDAVVHINDAYVYIGIRRAQIRNVMRPTSKYYDPAFPKPAPTPGKKTYFYRRDLVAYARRARNR